MSCAASVEAYCASSCAMSPLAIDSSLPCMEVTNVELPMPREYASASSSAMFAAAA